MPLFDIGDYVERVGAILPERMRLGRVVWVVPHTGTPEHLIEYAVDFGFGVAIYCQVELRLAEESPLHTDKRSSVSS
jgi:hypothetical protein